MQFTIISGSHRSQSQSSRIAHYLQRELLAEKLCDNCEIIDLADNPLPLWEEKIWDGDPEWQQRLAPYSAIMEASDAYVLVAPEWHGMVPAGLKNFLLFWRADQVGHKPALITTVAAGLGGAYPVAELRMSGYKNNRLCFLPEHLIIRNAPEVLHDDPTLNTADNDTWLRPRISYALKLLHQYAKAFRQIRASGVIDHKEFPSGL